MKYKYPKRMRNAKKKIDQSAQKRLRQNER